MASVWRAIRPMLVLGLVAFVAACKPAPQAAAIPADAVLKVGSQRGSTKSLLLASHALDGAPYRIEWSEFPAAQHLLEALSAGAVDTGEVGDAPFLFAYAAGSRIHVAHAYRAENLQGSAVSIIVPKGSTLRTAADLKGKRVATGRGSIGHYLLLKALEQAKIRPDEVKVVFLDPGQAKAALASGSVDAWSTWGPYTGIAVLQDGARILVPGTGLVNSIGFQVAADGAIANKHAILLDFMTRLSRAQSWAAAHKEEVAQILSKETGLPADVALYTIKSRGDLRPALMDAQLIKDEQQALDLYRSAGAVSTTRGVDQAFDPSFNAAVTP
ncbi:MAG: ABC transporter substrate-binding protein [Caulobacteraceae bacterium]